MTPLDVRRLLYSAPHRLTGAGSGEASYELADDLVAVHRADAESPMLLAVAAGEVSYEPGAQRSEWRGDAVVGPVYRRRPAGEVAVPTGRAFVRFSEGERAEDRREGFAATGFELDAIPPYAPHAAWVRASCGAIEETLRSLDRLRALAGVEHVEPQLIVPAHPRPLG